MAETIFILLYIVSSTYEVLMMYFNNRYYGDAAMAPYNLSKLQLIFSFAVYIATWLVLYRIYKRFGYKKDKKINYRIYVNKNKGNIAFLIWVIIYMAYTIITGVGVSGSTATSSYSFVFSMLDINAIFPFYYISCRKEDIKSLFWINVLMYCTLRILQGWTGFILNIFLYELYYYVKKKKIRKNMFAGFVLVALVLIAGAEMYRILYPLKMAIRFGYTFKLDYALDFQDALAALVSRISPFSRSAYIIFNLDNIKAWYLYDGKLLQEIQAFLKPVVPRFIMHDKDFMSLSECIFAAVTDSYKPNVSSGVGVFVYAAALFYCDWQSGIIWLLLLSIYIHFMKRIYANLEIQNGQMKILYFQFVLRFISTGSLEVLFFQNEFKLLFIVPVLMICGVIKAERNPLVNVLNSCEEII